MAILVEQLLQVSLSPFTLGRVVHDAIDGREGQFSVRGFSSDTLGRCVRQTFRGLPFQSSLHHYVGRFREQKATPRVV